MPASQPANSLKQRPAAAAGRAICWPGVLLMLVFFAGCAAIQETGQPSARDQAAAEQQAKPTNAYYHYLAAQLRQSEGAKDKALQELAAAYHIDSATPMLGRELAVMLVQSDDNEQALQVVEKTLEAHPDDVSTLVIYGRIQQETKNMAAAVDAFEKVLALNPDRQDIYLHLGGIYLENDDAAEAKAVFQRLVDRFPDAYAGYFYLGRLAVAEKDDATAEHLFVKTLAIKEDLDEPRFELADIYARQGRTAEAVEQYQALILNNKNNIRAALGLGIVYHESGDTQKSQMLLEDIGRRFGNDSRLPRTIAGLYVDRKEFNGARIVLEGVMLAQPVSPEILYLAGLTYEGLDAWEKAIAHLRKIPQSSRLYRDAAVHIAFIYQEKGMFDDAIDYLTGVLPQIDDNAEFYYYLGSLSEEKGVYDDAVQWLTQGLEKAPNDVKMHFRLGVIYDKQGNKDASIDQMRKTIALDADHASALNYLGYTYADLGINLDEAEAMIRRALAIKPDDGYITDSLGWVFFKKGQIDEALRWLHKAVALAPDDPVIVEHLGDAYHRAGDIDKALEHYRKALEIKTQDRDPLIEKLKRLESTSAP